MNQDRRAFIALMASVACMPMAAKAQFVGAKTRSLSSTLNPFLLSAFDDHQGQHYVGVYNPVSQHWLHRIRVSQRYHSCGIRYTEGQSTPQWVFVARRPGNEMVVLDFVSKDVRVIQAEQGRHFYGHVAFDLNGRAWSTENEYESGRGMLVCREGRFLDRVVTEIDLAGIGPHELAFLSDMKTLAVGLGGIETHPEFPRKKLNLDSMRSELLRVDTQQQTIEARFSPESPQLSLRHLDCVDDLIVVAAQFQGPAYEQYPLVYFQDAGSELIAFDAPDSVWRSMRQYIASVQINKAKEEVLVTCPRANAVHLFSLTTGKWMAQYRLIDPGGVTLDSQAAFLVSTGGGKIVCLSSKKSTLILEREWLVGDTRWDNHMDQFVFAR